MRYRSKRMERVYRKRRPMVAEIVGKAEKCAVPWCTETENLTPHEPLTRARGGSLTDPKNCVAVCWAHNQELTLEPAWGYKTGLLRHSWDM